MDLWRISNHADLRGMGGLQAAGRWHFRGKAIVYLADHPARCILEMLVHVDRDLIPNTYRLLKIAVNEATRVESVDPLPSGWQDQLTLTRKIGDDWLDRGSSALLQVPSVIVPHGKNYCLNPNHPDSRQVMIAEIIETALDPRLIGSP